MTYYTHRGTALIMIEMRGNGTGLYKEVLTGAHVVCSPETLTARV